MRRLVGLGVGLLGLLLVAAPVRAAPVYVTGNECPSDAQMVDYTRQYGVTPSTRCVFDPASNNIQGTDAEADLYLNSLAANAAGWGTISPADNWSGLGQNPTGFSFTADAGNDNGTFTIGAVLDAQYDQFALAIKDGQLPYWAVFLIPAGTTSGNWDFLTGGGDLSHFALFGRDNLPPDDDPPDDDPPDDDPPPAPIPEPATLLMLGAGLVGIARQVRRRRQ